VTARPCTNCAWVGHRALSVLGHACVDVDPCERCGGARMLRVIAIAAEGGVTRERTCEQCRRQRRELEAAE